MKRPLFSGSVAIGVSEISTREKFVTYVGIAPRTNFSFKTTSTKICVKSCAHHTHCLNNNFVTAAFGGNAGSDACRSL